MSLEKSRVVFGVHQVTAVNRSTGMPYGTAFVVQGSTFKMEGDTVELRGGSNKFAVAIEDGDINAELGFNVSEYPNWLFEVFGGKAPTQGAAEASGNVSALTDKFGTSVVAATGLLSTITTTTASDLKFGKYVIKATAVDEVKIYALTNVDFGRGTSLDYSDDSLLIDTWTGITTGSTHLVPSLGITLTAGASATVMTIGHTATFEIRPINTLNRSVKIGGISDIFPEFTGLIYAQKSGSGAVFEIEAYKLKAIGVGLGAERKQFGQNEYTAKAAYDTVENAICRIRECE